MRPGSGFGTPGELWAADLDSSHTERVLKGFSIGEYDISADGKQVVFSAAAPDHLMHLWLAPLDRSAAPQQIPFPSNAEKAVLGSVATFFSRGMTAPGTMFIR